MKKSNKGLAPTRPSVDFQWPHHLEILSLLLRGLRRAHIPLTPLCTALGAAGGMVPHFAHSDLTLQIHHIIAAEKVEGVELELGRVLLVGVEVDIGIVFDAPLPDQIILDSRKITGIWRSHTGIHEEPQAGIRALECGLEEDRFPLAGIVWPQAHGRLEEGYGHIIPDTLPWDVSPGNDFNCRRAIHPAGELQLRHLVPHDDPARVTPYSASDGVGVAEGAETFLSDGATATVGNVEDQVAPCDSGTAQLII